MVGYVFSFRLKGTWQLNAISNPILDSILTEKEMLYEGDYWVY